MRVLHVIPSVAARYGGPSAAIRGLASAQAAIGLSVAVATTDADGANRLDVPLRAPVHDAGVEYYYFPRSLPGEYKLSLPLAGWLRRNVARFDVVHVHALFSFATIPACRFASRRGVPYVLRPLGTLGEWSLAHRGWKKGPYLRLIERRHLDEAAALHATSLAEAEAFTRLGYGAKARVIPLGVDIASREDAAPDARSGMEGAPRGDQPLRLLFLSRLHPVKNLPLLLQAVAQLRNTTTRRIELTVAGAGEPTYLAELRRETDRHGLNEDVHFVGHLDGDRKRDAFAQAEYFVLPSSHENFGLAAAEALAHGVPVILAEGVAIADEVARAGAGVVVEASPEALARQLGRLAADPELRTEMSRAALALARREYSWPRAAERCAALYDELTTQRAAAS